MLAGRVRRARGSTVVAMCGAALVVAGAVLLVAGSPGPADIGALPATASAPAPGAALAPAAAPAAPAPGAQARPVVPAGPAGPAVPTGPAADSGSAGLTGPAGPPGSTGPAAETGPGTVTAPGSLASAAAAGSVPVRLELPDRGVTAPVVPVGTSPTGALVVPDPPSTVGWWSPSALPGGTAGATVLAGHVDSAAAGLGALAVLREVDVGERVLLRGADGRETGYRVVARRQYAKAELPPEVFAAGGPPQLVLITCGGRFDPATRHYADNVVVHAVPEAP